MQRLRTFVYGDPPIQACWLSYRYLSKHTNGEKNIQFIFFLLFFFFNKTKRALIRGYPTLSSLASYWRLPKSRGIKAVGLLSYEHGVKITFFDNNLQDKTNSITDVPEHKMQPSEGRVKLHLYVRQGVQVQGNGCTRYLSPNVGAASRFRPRDASSFNATKRSAKFR